MTAKLILFSNPSCPFCQRARRALQSANIDFELVTIPMSGRNRAKTIYQGENKKFQGKSFAQLFDGDLTIPKAITPKGEKLMESHQIMEYADSQ